MKIRVVMKEDGELAKMQAAFERRSASSDLQVQFTQAPSNLNYIFPFPFVEVESGDEIQRQYGEDAITLYYAALGQNS